MKSRSVLFKTIFILQILMSLSFLQNKASAICLPGKNNPNFEIQYVEAKEWLVSDSSSNPYRYSNLDDYSKIFTSYYECGSVSYYIKSWIIYVTTSIIGLLVLYFALSRLKKYKKIG